MHADDNYSIAVTVKCVFKKPKIKD